MMRVQEIWLPDTGERNWILLGDDFLPDEPVNRFLSFLRSLQRSPRTIQVYAFHLKLYCQYLAENGLDWAQAGVDELAGFVHWLTQTPKYHAQVLPFEQLPPPRTKRTIYAILSAVHEFYTYHIRIKSVPHIVLYDFVVMPHRSYKDFLYHATKSLPVKTRIVNVKPEERKARTVPADQVKLLIDACTHLRDRFLVSLLYNSGMRIGQCLGLRHEDVRTWDNEIDIVPRDNNLNGARAKTRTPYTVHVPMKVMQLYTDYVLQELVPLVTDAGTLPDYVFVNLWDGERGHPMTYANARDLLERLRKTVSKQLGTEIVFHAHLLRHTYATEKLRGNVPVEVVSKQLGHSTVATTSAVYSHLTAKDMKVYLQEKGEREPE